MRDFRKFRGFLDAWWCINVWQLKRDNKMIPQVSPCMWKCKFRQTSEHPKWVHSWLKFLSSQDFSYFHSMMCPSACSTMQASGRFFVRLGGLPIQLQASCVLVDGVSPLIPAHKVTWGNGGGGVCSFNKKQRERMMVKGSLNKVLLGDISCHQRCLSNKENVFPFLYTVRVFVSCVFFCSLCWQRSSCFPEQILFQMGFAQASHR